MRNSNLLLAAVILMVGLSAGSCWGAAVLMSTDGSDPQVFGVGQGHTVIGGALATLLDPNRLYNIDGDATADDTIFDFDIVWVILILVN